MQHIDMEKVKMKVVQLKLQFVNNPYLQYQKSLENSLLLNFEKDQKNLKFQRMKKTLCRLVQPEGGKVEGHKFFYL